MELYEKGLIGKRKSFFGFEVGNAQAAEILIRMVVNREGFEMYWQKAQSRRR